MLPGMARSSKANAKALVLLLLPLTLAAPACSGGSAVPDAGTTGVDAGSPPHIACDSPEDCRVAGFDGACRAGVCKANVPCGDDSECGLGETCTSGQCRFTGCVQDSDCAVGRCRAEAFACTECSASADCPSTLPVCSAEGRCIQCGRDSDCPAFGPAFCTAIGACAHCLEDAHCPNGLRCGENGVCLGAQKNQVCNQGVACDVGLTCVTIGGTRTVCAEACNLFTPLCQTPGEICIKLTFADSASLVFDQGAPLGVCFPPVNGAKGYHENCDTTICQPNLECIPDSATRSSCKTYCDPEAPFCAPGEKCHAFPGDWSGRQYGVCYPDTGFHDRCDADNDCRAGQHCVPDDDPSAGNGFALFCAFAVESAPASASALTPCDEDADCGSGACRADPEVGGAPSFCFGACREDADCNVGGRQGVCDADFLFSTEYAKDVKVRGCRPL